jgi:hypothetical protein
MEWPWAHPSTSQEEKIIRGTAKGKMRKGVRRGDPVIPTVIIPIKVEIMVNPGRVRATPIHVPTIWGWGRPAM